MGACHHMSRAEQLALINIMEDGKLLTDFHIDFERL